MKVRRMSKADAVVVGGEAGVADPGEPNLACCAPGGAPDAGLSGDAEGLAPRFKALADPNRLRILSIVSASDEGEVCVCDLPGPLGLSQPTVSHHLRILVDAGLLSREKRGVWAYFSLVPGALAELADVLAGRMSAAPRATSD